MQQGELQFATHRYIKEEIKTIIKEEESFRKIIFDFPKECDKVKNDFHNHTEIKKIEKEKSSAKKEKIHRDFEDFWTRYDKRVGNKDKVLKKWLNLTDIDRECIFNTLDDYIKSTPEKKYRKNVETYLNNKSWNDEIIIHKKPEIIKKENDIFLQDDFDYIGCKLKKNNYPMTDNNNKPIMLDGYPNYGTDEYWEYVNKKHGKKRCNNGAIY